MKKILTPILLLLTIFCAAQTSSRDIVYLKNGSIVRGLITELVPNESLKIETADGSLFVFKMEEVTKIEKEKTNGSSNGDSGSNNNSETNNSNKISEARASAVDSWLRSKVQSQSENALKFISFTKTNGQSLRVQGYYQIEFEIILTPVCDIYRIGNSMEGYWTNFSVFRSASDAQKYLQNSALYLTYNAIHYVAYEKLKFTGTATVVEKDNGPSVERCDLKTYTPPTGKSDYTLMSSGNNSKQDVSNNTGNAANPNISPPEKPRENKKYYNLSECNIYNRESGKDSIETIDYYFTVPLEKYPSQQNVEYAIQKIIDNCKRFTKPISSSIEDSISIGKKIEIIYGYNFSTDVSNGTTFYSTNMTIRLLLYSDKVVLKDQFIRSSTGFMMGNASQLNSALDVVSKMEKDITKFIFGSFPVNALVDEILDINSKGDAKKVKVKMFEGQPLRENMKLALVINKQKQEGYQLNVESVDETSNTAICKVTKMGDKIASDLKAGQKIIIESVND